MTLIDSPQPAAEAPLPDGPLAYAVHALGDALDGLTTTADVGTVSALGPHGAIAFARQYEQLRHRMAIVDHPVAGAFDETRVAQLSTLRNTTTALAEALHLSRGEAHNRVTAAAALASRSTLTGAPMPPLRAHLAAQQHAGRASAAQASVIISALHHLDGAPGVSTLDVEEAETELSAHAAAPAPADPRKAAEAPDRPPRPRRPRATRRPP